MEQRETTLAERINFAEFEDAHCDDELVRQRLDWFLAENARFRQGMSLTAREIDNAGAAAMRRPLNLEQTFSKFGLMIGVATPAAFFIKFAIEAVHVEPWVFGMMAITNLLAAIVGFFSGKVVAKVVRTLEGMSWPAMIALLPVLGLCWGIVTGSLSGVVIFGIGAFFGGILGGMVGAAALPAFTILHRLVKKGESIEEAQFLPLAMGVTGIICGFIASFKI